MSICLCLAWKRRKHFLQYILSSESSAILIAPLFRKNSCHVISYAGFLSFCSLLAVDRSILVVGLLSTGTAVHIFLESTAIRLCHIITEQQMQAACYFLSDLKPSQSYGKPDCLSHWQKINKQ